MTERNERRALQGTVTSTKATQTITVSVERTFKHPKYGKFVRKRKKYMAHDGKEDAQMGDLVEITATRPISKRKRWRLAKVLDRNAVTEDHVSVEGYLKSDDGEGDAT